MTSTKTPLFWTLALGLTLVKSPLAATVETAVEEAAQAGKINGSVLVTRGDQVLLERSYGLANAEWNLPNSANTRYPVGSVTKPFTAMLVLQAVERGELALDTRLGSAVPEVSASAFADVTVHHLLSQSTGFPEFEIDSFESFDRANFWATLRGLEPVFAAGEKFDYRNENFTTLALILERVTGRSYAELLEDFIVRPLALHNTGVFDGSQVVQRMAAGYDWTKGEYQLPSLNNLGNAIGSGFIYSTTRDLWVFARAVRDGRLLGPELTAKMKTAMSGPYEYGWLVRPMGSAGTLLFHPGRVPGYSSALALTDSGVVVVVLNNFTSGPMVELARTLVTEALQEQSP